MVSKSIKHVIPEGNLESKDPHSPTIVKKNKKKDLGKYFTTVMPE